MSADATAMLIEELSNLLHEMEWVRQPTGHRYYCPTCHGVSERDGGEGHAEDCRANRVRYEAETWLRAAQEPR